MKDALAYPLDVKLMNMTALVLLLAFISMGMATTVRWLGARQFFALRAIAVSGDVAHNNEITLRANVAPRIAGTYFTVDLAQVRAAFEAMPWIRKAVVHREFPNRLRVQLQEHQAVAYWGSDGDSRLVNSFGEVFEANVGEVDQEALPRLSGPDGLGAAVLAMYRALQPLFGAMEMDIDSLDLSRGGTWSVRLDSGARIEMGRGSVDEVTARVQRFLKTLTQVLTRFGRPVGAVESADLRHENGYALRLQGVVTQQPSSSKK